MSHRCRPRGPVIADIIRGVGRRGCRGDISAELGCPGPVEHHDPSGEASGTNTAGSSRLARRSQKSPSLNRPVRSHSPELAQHQGPLGLGDVLLPATWLANEYYGADVHGIATHLARIHPLRCPS